MDDDSKNDKDNGKNGGTQTPYEKPKPGSGHEPPRCPICGLHITGCGGH